MRQQIESMTNEEIISRTRMFEANIKAMKADLSSLTREKRKASLIFRANNGRDSGE
jgi:hypothetical protein